MSNEFKLTPVAWQFLSDGKWHNGDDRIKDHRKNTEEAGYPTRDLYASGPQPALGGEPEVFGMVYGQRVIRLIDHRAHLTPLQTEIERLEKEVSRKTHCYQVERANITEKNAEIDQLKARCNELEESLEQIATWPDGGNTYGQDKIKGFASRILYGSEHV